jgi:oxygen-independent coproporphyrinogen-3 oxidase
MDHFALPHDDLYVAREEGRLHRNFMGYTTRQTGLLLGLGVSSISDAGYAFAQNEKSLHDYYRAIQNGQLAITRGFTLDAEDVSFRSYILDISCRGRTEFRVEDLPVLEAYVFPRMEELERDGLVVRTDKEVRVTEKGQSFIRNICAAFDVRMHRQHHPRTLFSKAI